MKTIIIPIFTDPAKLPFSSRPSHTYQGTPVACRMVADNVPVSNGCTALAGTVQELVDSGDLVPIPPPITFYRAKRLREIQSAFDAEITRGITVGDLTLRAGESDRSAFSQLLVMLSEAERIGQLPGVVSIADAQGVPHVLPVCDVRRALVSYGAQYHALWSSFVTAKNKITAASTPEEIAAVSMS